MTLSEAIARRAAASGMTAAQALSYRAGALEARVIIQTAAEESLRRLSSKERTPSSA
ncbi:hypothetical protein AB4Y72_16365 [Arthrobacter sp. YAF34]|uniref:hypothetical protein n=1 Tax=Arthrobacter sp. YAF34 TaxID=3233083 RepID=UPI003F8F419D